MSWIRGFKLGSDKMRAGYAVGAGSPRPKLIAAVGAGSPRPRTGEESTPEEASTKKRSRFFQVVVLLTLCGYSSVVYAQSQFKLHLPGAVNNGNESVTGVKAINRALRYPLRKEYPVTSPFGWRVHPVTGKRKLHEGLDIGAPFGIPVLAAMSGKVVFAEFNEGGGNEVAVEDDDTGYQTWYVHLSKISVTVGQRVGQGEVVGFVGATGRLVTGPHLHFGLKKREGGDWVFKDPSAYLGGTITIPSKPMAPSVNDTAFQEDIPDCAIAVWGKCKGALPSPKPTPLPDCQNAVWGPCTENLNKNIKLELKEKTMK